MRKESCRYFVDITKNVVRTIYSFVFRMIVSQKKRNAFFKVFRPSLHFLIFPSKGKKKYWVRME